MSRCLFDLPSLLTSLLLLALSQSVSSAGFQFVTCGSAMKLSNLESNARLHSHDVKYGSGSGQQSVTGAKFADDVNSYWLVKGAHGKHCNRGTPVACGATVRFHHLNTRLFLHSHLFRSPLSGNQEVSCFGDGNVGDEGDNWVIECDGDFWRRDEAIRLKHASTSVYLHVAGQTYGRPIAGQYEVSGSATKSRGNFWQAMEGVYMEPDL